VQKTKESQLCYGEGLDKTKKTQTPDKLRKVKQEEGKVQGKDAPNDHP